VCDVNLREFPSCKLDPILLMMASLVKSHIGKNKIKYWNERPLGKFLKGKMKNY
jgi:hypothetical protein